MNTKQFTGFRPSDTVSNTTVEAILICSWHIAFSFKYVHVFMKELRVFSLKYVHISTKKLSTNINALNFECFTSAWFS